MDPTQVMNNISKACEGLGIVELDGVRLETGDPRLLDVSEFDLDRHAALQPAAVAYYGMLKKAARRRLDNMKAAYDRWEKKKYAEAKAAVLSGTSAPSSIKVEDVKARFIIDNEPEIVKWERQLEDLQRQSDDMDSWYEAWKQKSFSMREMVSITEDERYNSESSISRRIPDIARSPMGGSKSTRPVVSDRVREIIAKKRGGAQAQA